MYTPDLITILRPGSMVVGPKAILTLLVTYRRDGGLPNTSAMPAGCGSLR